MSGSGGGRLEWAEDVVNGYKIGFVAFCGLRLDIIFGWDKTLGTVFWYTE